MTVAPMSEAAKASVRRSVQDKEGLKFLMSMAAAFLVLFGMVRKAAAAERYGQVSIWGVILVLLVSWVVHRPEDREIGPSILITMGAALQLLAFGLLYLAPDAYRAPKEFGVIMAVAIVPRIVVTMLRNGYLPVDDTGNGCIQFMEFLAFLFAMYGVRRGKSMSNPQSCYLAIFICAILGYLCCGELDHLPVADETYAFTIYCEVAAWFFMTKLFTPIRGPAPAAILPAACQAFCRAGFWFVALEDVRVKDPVRLQPIFPEVLMGAHVLIGILALNVSCFKAKVKDIPV
jgi:hypothetical protein